MRMGIGCKAVFQMIPKMVIALIALQLIDNGLVPQKNGNGMRLFTEGSRALIFPAITTNLRLLVSELVFLLGCTRFNNQHLVSLAQQFGVSDSAMAIRLKELELVRWP